MVAPDRYDRVVTRLRGEQPKCSNTQEAHRVQPGRPGNHASARFAELFGDACCTLHRASQRAGGLAKEAPAPGAASADTGTIVT